MESRVIKVSFNEELQRESEQFMMRLIEKILIDELQLSLHKKGSLLLESRDIVYRMDKE